MKRILSIALAAVLVGLLSGAPASAQNCSGQPAANMVCAGPSSGGAGFPSFRALVPADVPALTVGATTIASGTSTATSRGILFNKNGILGDSSNDATGGPIVINNSGVASLPSFQGLTPTLWLSGPQNAATQGETILLGDSWGANANFTMVGSKSGGAQFTGRIDNGTPGNAGTVLTVSAMANLNGTTAPNSIVAGQILFSGGSGPITAGTSIVSQTSGTTGGVGVYQVNISQSVAAGGIWANDLPSNPQITQDGNIIFAQSANGWAGSPAVRMSGSALMLMEGQPGGGNWSPTSTPTRFRFVTTPVGCISQTCGNVDRLYIEASGEIVERLDNVGAGPSLGFTLRNYTTAALGAQQNSPSLHWRGSAWDTGTSASKSVEWIASASAIQGNPPTTSLVFSHSINSGSVWTRDVSITSAGGVDAATAFTIAGAVAPTGRGLRSDGVNGFVSGQFLFSDLSGTPTTLAGYGIASPLPVPQGGTNCAAASGTCLDNITGFSTNGLVNRTGTGSYGILSLPLSFAVGGNNDTGTVCTSFTPSVTITGGTGTNSTGSTGCYKQIAAKEFTVSYNIIVNYATIPTSYTVTLPNSFAATATVVIFGQNTTTGNMLQARINASATSSGNVVDTTGAIGITGSGQTTILSGNVFNN